MPINPLSSSDQEADDKNKKYNLISGESANVTGFAPGQSASAGAPSASSNSSGSFTNLQSYLDANKDQSAGLGAKIEDNVNNTANQGRTELANTSQKFNEGVDAAGIDRNKLSRDALTNIVDSAYNSPNSLTDDSVKNFADIRDKNKAFQAGTDAAPKALTDVGSYAGAQQKLNEAKDQANLTGTESGRQTLLKQSFAKPSYTAGQTSLDQLLTQNVPENKSRFENLRNNLTGDAPTSLVSQQNQALQAASDKRLQMKNDLASANQDEQDLFYNPNGLTGTFSGNQYVDHRLDPLQGQNLQRALQIMPQKDADGNEYISSGVNQYGVLTDQDKAALALQDQLKKAQDINYQNQLNSMQNRMGTQQTLGADFTPAVQKVDGSAPTLNNALTPADYARIQALNALAGRQSGTIGDKVITGLDSSQFDPTVNFNRDLANQILTNKSNQFKSDMGNALNFQGSSVPGYRWGDMPASAAANDIIRRLIDNDPQPGMDTAPADAVINTYSAAVDNANKVRANYGLAPLNVNDFYDGGNPQEGFHRAASEYLGGVTPISQNIHVYPNQAAINTAIDKMNAGQEGYGYNADVTHNIQQVAQIKALQNLMNANAEQMKNPTKMLPGSAPNGGRVLF